MPCMEDQQQKDDAPNGEGIAGRGEERIVFVAQRPNGISVEPDGSRHIVSHNDGDDDERIDEGIESFHFTNYD